jgi:hypothetical protein
MKKKLLGIACAFAVIGFSFTASSFTEDTEGGGGFSKDCVMSNTTPTSSTVECKGKGKQCNAVLNCAILP